MNIIVGEKSGFCAGVSFTVNRANKLLEQYGKVYCLGEIVHNEKVIESLEKKGMITVDTIDEIPNNSKVIFRAHGEAKNVYDKAQKKKLEIFDLTCGKVKLIHNKIEKNNDSFVIIIGKKVHPETIGHFGYIDDGYVIENMDDIKEACENFQKSKKKKIYVVAQTTFNEDNFDEIVTEIKNEFGCDIEVNKTICNATRERQEEVIKIAKEVDTMIIVGGKNSSNTKELYNLAINYCNKVCLIQDADDLRDIEFSKNGRVGIMAGASTPNEVTNEIINFIKK